MVNKPIKAAFSCKFPSSSMVERSAVNRGVLGSSPSWGAREAEPPGPHSLGAFSCLLSLWQPAFVRGDTPAAKRLNNKASKVSLLAPFRAPSQSLAVIYASLQVYGPICGWTLLTFKYASLWGDIPIGAHAKSTP